MDQFFDLEVSYNSKSLRFETHLVRMRFTYHFQVKVGNQNIIFEPEEEGSYRAILDSPVRDVDQQLLKAISDCLQALSMN